MVDLDDAAELAARDPGRLLAIARAGATVRQVAHDAAWSGEAELRGAEIGSVGVLLSELLAPSYGAALADLTMRLGAPVAATLVAVPPTGQFPRAADVLVVLSVNGLERRLLEGLHLGASRGATTIVVAPEGSPIAVAAAERHVVLATFDADDPVTAWWAGVAAVVAALSGARALDSLADALDDAAARLGPVVETFDNPAKQIALLTGPVLVVFSDDDAALAGPLLAHEIGAHSTWSVRSVDARRGLDELLDYVNERPVPAAADLFYDPQIDGPPATAPVRQIVFTTGATGQGQPRTEALELAERIGTVRTVAFGSDERWSAVSQILLAQLSGSYFALAKD